MLRIRILALAILCALVATAVADETDEDMDRRLDDLMGESERVGVRYVDVEAFDVPGHERLPMETLNRLSRETGVAGTDIVGIRLKIGIGRGYRFERLDAGIADGLFLVEQRSFMSRVGGFLLHVARFLLLGQLVSAGSALEIPAQSWGLLVSGEPAADADTVELYTRSELSLEMDDRQATNHGDFVICRFILAANELSELVNLRVETRDRSNGDWLHYNLPRLELPRDRPAASRASRTVR